jgi:hypothetical protein
MPCKKLPFNKLYSLLIGLHVRLFVYAGSWRECKLLSVAYFFVGINVKFSAWISILLIYYPRGIRRLEFFIFYFMVASLFLV